MTWSRVSSRMSAFVDSRTPEVAVRRSSIVVCARPVIAADEIPVNVGSVRPEMAVTHAPVSYAVVIARVIVVAA